MYCRARASRTSGPSRACTCNRLSKPLSVSREPATEAMTVSRGFMVQEAPWGETPRATMGPFRERDARPRDGPMATAPAVANTAGPPAHRPPLRADLTALADLIHQGRLPGCERLGIGAGPPTRVFQMRAHTPVASLALELDVQRDLHHALNRVGDEVVVQVERHTNAAV